MTFFDDKYLEMLREKEQTGKLSKLARPAFRLAVFPKHQPLRNSINDIFKDLPVDSQGRLRKKRNDFENISQTVNEIRVGSYLISKGYKVEPEKKIDSLTPDWFATAEDGKELIVEVLTKTISDKDKIENEYIIDLRNLSKKVLIGAILSLKCGSKGKAITWSDDLIEIIVLKLESWLKSKPLINSHIEIEGLKLELWRYSEKLNYIRYVITGNAFAVDSLPLKTNIERKVEKYRDICNKNNLPLVVACLPSFSTVIGKEEFEDICDDIFASHPNLNSIWAFIDDEIEVFGNPEALFSI